MHPTMRPDFSSRCLVESWQNLQSGCQLSWLQNNFQAVLIRWGSPLALASFNLGGTLWSTMIEATGRKSVEHMQQNGLSRRN